MRDENELILLAVLKNRTEEEQQRLNELTDKKMDWGYIAGQLTHHRLSGYFLRGLNDLQKHKLHYELRIALELIVKSQEQQTKEISRHILPVLRVFEDRKIRYAALKGLVLNACLYTIGERRSNDSDILVLEDDLEQIDAILTADGYRQSLFDGDGFRPMTPEEKKRQREYYHDFPYVKSIDTDFIKYHMIDLNIRYDSRDNEITKEIFSYGLCKYQGVAYHIWGLPWETNLAHLCVHFYREGSESFFIHNRTDIVLYKIADIANIIRLRPERREWLDWINMMMEWNLQKAAYFTLYHVTRLYRGIVPAEVLDALAPQDLSFMQEISISDENRMEQRTHSLLQAAFDLCY